MLRSTSASTYALRTRPSVPSAHAATTIVAMVRKYASVLPTVTGASYPRSQSRAATAAPATPTATAPSPQRAPRQRATEYVATGKAT